METKKVPPEAFFFFNHTRSPSAAEACLSQHRPPVVPTLEASLPSETGRSCRVSTVTPSRWFSRCLATVCTYCHEPTLYVWVSLRFSIMPKTVSSGIPRTTSVARGVRATSLGWSSWSREITGEPRGHATTARNKVRLTWASGGRPSTFSQRQYS